MIYKSNAKAVIDKLNVKLKGLKNQKKLLRDIAVSLQTSNIRRIHNEGKAVTGKIGSYSTKPTLIGAKSFRKKTTAAKVFGSKKKRSKLKWRKVRSAGNVVNLAVLEGGYKAIRSLDGDKVAFVNLQRTGDLKRAFEIATISGGYGVGFNNATDAKKAKALESKYGKIIWGISQADNKAIDRIIAKELKKKIGDITK